MHHYSLTDSLKRNKHKFLFFELARFGFPVYTGKSLMIE